MPKVEAVKIVFQLTSTVMEVEKRSQESTKDEFIDVLSGQNPNWLLFDEILLTVTYCGNFMDFVNKSTEMEIGGGSGFYLYGLGMNVVKKLRHLSDSFFAVIFQEGLKCFQKEEPSAIALAIQVGLGHFQMWRGSLTNTSTV